jgi:hypothetical protein
MCLPYGKRKFAECRGNFIGPMMCCCSGDMSKENELKWLREHKKDLEKEIKDIEEKIRMMEGDTK